MIYIERDGAGKISAIRRDDANNSPDKEGLTSENLMEFLVSDEMSLSSYKKVLEHMDSEFIRVLDDLVDVLVQKKVILLTDLPEDARKKIFDRKAVRQKIKEPNVIVDDIL